MERFSLKKEYQVHVYETGPDGKLNLHSLFDFFQDIASDHAVRLGFGRDDLMKNNSFWVLSRIYAEISELPSWGETLTVKTWPRGTDKLFALRDFEASVEDGRSVALATSSWLIVDRDTRRIQRPGNTLGIYNSSSGGKKSLLRNATKVEPASPYGRYSQPFNVRISDLDINLHTNNTRYLKWITDTYGLDFTLKNTPKSAEINYLAESHFDDNVVIKTSEDVDGRSVFNHSIFKVSDNSELCRASISWKKNQM